MTEFDSRANPFTDYTPDDRSVPYGGVADVLRHVAQKCGVTVDDTTHVRWQQAGGLMREFDTFADDYAVKRGIDPMPVLRDFSLFAERYPALTPETLGANRFKLQVHDVETILKIGKAIAATTDPNEYIELRKAEAYYTTKAFMHLATPETQQQNGFNEFEWRVTGLSIAANLGDSILDIRRDRRSGKVEIGPSWTLYKGLAYDAARHGRRHVRYVLDKEGAKLRVKMIRRRISNRLSSILHGRGIPEYSNLRLFAGKKTRRG